MTVTLVLKLWLLLLRELVLWFMEPFVLKELLMCVGELGLGRKLARKL